jgi:hypothetical protein
MMFRALIDFFLLKQPLPSPPLLFSILYMYYFTLFLKVFFLFKIKIAKTIISAGIIFFSRPTNPRFTIIYSSKHKHEYRTYKITVVNLNLESS